MTTQHFKENWPKYTAIVMILLYTLMVARSCQKIDKPEPAKDRLMEIVDSLKKEIAFNNTVVSVKLEEIKRLGNQIKIVESKTNKTIEKHHDRITYINRIDDSELGSELSWAMGVLDSLDASNGFLLLDYRKTNKTSN